jgi:RNA polymerase sigma-70 factor (ECF subfamily)
MEPQKQGQWLAQRFEENRGHLRAVAYRMLGSASEADDAVQEAWLRLDRTGAEGVENLSGWLTTVVSRVCLDMLRSRASRREETLDVQAQTPAPHVARARDPEQETILAESVGLALLVVLETLEPAERLAFVLHDMFAVPFEEIAGILGRSSEATRQLASRARHRVQGVGRASPGDLKQQKEVIDAFLAALRAGDIEALVRVLDPDVVFHADATAAAAGAAQEVRGAEAWARQAITFSRGVRFAQTALVESAVGIVVAPRGRLFRVLRFALKDGKIAEVELIGDADRLRQLDLAVLDDRLA